jgi:hypothetical protein
VAERHGHWIDPLEVVDEQGDRLEAGKPAVDRLEDADRVEPADLCLGIEQTKERPVLARRREAPEERCCRGEGDPGLGLVTREAHDARAALRVFNFVEQARLSDPRLADQE